MKWPTTEVLGEGSFETATPSRDKAGKKKKKKYGINLIEIGPF